MISDDMKYFYWVDTEYVYVCAKSEKEAIQAILDEIESYWSDERMFLSRDIVLKEMHRFDPVTYEFDPNSGDVGVSFYDYVKHWDNAQVLFVEDNEVYFECEDWLARQ